MPISTGSISAERCFVDVFLIILGFWAASAQAADERLVAPLDPFKAAEWQDARRQTLSEEQAQLARSRQELQAREAALDEEFTALGTELITDAMLEQARVDVDTARLDQDDVQATIASTERRIEELKKSIAELKGREQLLQNPAKEDSDEAQRKNELARVRQALQQQQTELELENLQLDNLRTRAELAAKRLTLAEQWHERLGEQYRFQQTQTRREAQESLKQRLQRQQQTYQEQAAELRQRLEREAEQLSTIEQSALQTRIRQAEEQARLTELDMRLADVDNTLTELEELGADQQAEAPAFEAGIGRLRALRTELQTDLELLQQKINLFEQRRQTIAQRENLAPADLRASAQEADLVGQLLEALKAREQQLRQWLTRADTVSARLEAEYAARLNQDLLARVDLPNTLAEWGELSSELKETPRILFHQVRLSVQSILQSLWEVRDPRWLGFAALTALIWGLLAVLRRRLKRLVERSMAVPDNDLANDVAMLWLILLQRNVLGLGVAATLLTLVWLFNVPQPGRGIVVTLALLWLSVKAAINLAWLLYASPRLPAAHRQPRLYWQWLAALSGAGLLVSLTILNQFVDLPEAAGVALDWLLALYTVLLAVPLWRARGFLILRLHRQYGRQRRFPGLKSVTFLVLATLQVSALVALAGYSNLGWMILEYLGIFTGVLLGWLVLQSQLNYGSNLLNDRLNRSDRSDFSLARDAVGPLRRILSGVLGVGAAVVLYRSYVGQVDFAIARPWQPLLAVLSTFVVYELLYFLANQLVRRSHSKAARSMVENTKKPMGIILPLAAAQIVTAQLGLATGTQEFILHLLTLTQIAAISWLAVRVVALFDELAEQRYYAGAKNKLAARRVRTQVRVLRQFMIAAVYMIAIASVLMTFPTVRQLGAGLIASAGAAGLILGIAARPFLENLIAGVQIGLTQPIRIDDHVIVEGEWGRIEEINATYVVVHIWDDRRLIVPLNYFNTQPFQNWTHRSSELIGSVFVHVDYTFPVEAAREELKRILDSTPLWDGRVCVLQVTDAKEHTLELRALMTARDAPTAWDLRCYARENLITFIQENYPECLPKVRAEFEQERRAQTTPVLEKPLEIGGMSA